MTGQHGWPSRLWQQPVADPCHDGVCGWSWCEDDGELDAGSDPEEPGLLWPLVVTAADDRSESRVTQCCTSHRKS